MVRKLGCSDGYRSGVGFAAGFGYGGSGCLPKAMRAFRFPIVTIHLYAFYALAAVILTHLAAVIVTEIHEGGSITSAMFSGRKILNRPPQDE